MGEIDQRAEGLGPFGHLGEFLIAVIVAMLLPIPAAFLHEPQAHDIFQKSHAVANAHFVGVVILQPPFSPTIGSFNSTPMSDHVPELM